MARELDILPELVKDKKGTHIIHIAAKKNHSHIVRWLILERNVDRNMLDGSGNSIDDIQAAIKAGMSVVHVNTEIRVAFRKALEESLSTNPEEVSPYKYMNKCVEAVEKVVEDKMRIFNFL